MKKIKEFIYNLPSRPSWTKLDDIEVEKKDSFLDIIVNDFYHIRIYPEGKELDVACADKGGYGYQDLLFDAEIMEHRNEILEMFNQ